MHDITPIILRETHTRRSAWRHKMLLQMMIRRANRIIVDSRQTKSDLITHLATPEAKIRVVHLAADPRYREVEDRRSLEDVRDRYGLAETFILFVGVLEPRKNIPTLISAFARIASSLPHQLVIAGKPGWGHEDILRAVEREGIGDRIIFAGFVPDEDLVLFYNTADFFVYPSLYEGFGLPVLEAMLCGCPVITSNISSLPEIAGGAALLVDPQDPYELAEAMREMASNASLRASLASKGKDRANLFSWERNALETLRVYRELAG